MRGQVQDHTRRQRRGLRFPGSWRSVPFIAFMLRPSLVPAWVSAPSYWVWMWHPRKVGTRGRLEISGERGRDFQKVCGALGQVMWSQAITEAQGDCVQGWPHCLAHPAMRLSGIPQVSAEDRKQLCIHPSTCDL